MKESSPPACSSSVNGIAIWSTKHDCSMMTLRSGCPTTASAANSASPREQSRSGLGSLGASIAMGGSSDVRGALVVAGRFTVDGPL